MSNCKDEPNRGACDPHAFAHPITANERAWIEVIRLASWDTDPGLTLERVQRLRLIFTRPEPSA